MHKRINMLLHAKSKCLQESDVKTKPHLFKSAEETDLSL